MIGERMMTSMTDFGAEKKEINQKKNIKIKNKKEERKQKRTQKTKM